MGWRHREGDRRRLRPGRGLRCHPPPRRGRLPLSESRACAVLVGAFADERAPHPDGSLLGRPSLLHESLEESR